MNWYASVSIFAISPSMLVLVTCRASRKMEGTAHVCVCVCVCVCECVCVCMCVGICVHACGHMCARVCMYI